MLKDCDSFSSLPTADLSTAKAFYEETLGLDPGDTMGGDEGFGVMYSAGSSKFLVYPSTFAGTNQATAMGFMVTAEDFDQVVADLRGKGVTFDTFEVPEGDWQDGVLVGMGMKSVWFKDPDGNILNVGAFA